MNTRPKEWDDAEEHFGPFTCSRPFCSNVAEKGSATCAKCKLPRPHRTKVFEVQVWE